LVSNFSQRIEKGRQNGGRWRSEESEREIKGHLIIKIKGKRKTGGCYATIRAYLKRKRPGGESMKDREKSLSSSCLRWSFNPKGKGESVNLKGTNRGKRESSWRILREGRHPQKLLKKRKNHPRTGKTPPLGKRKVVKIGLAGNKIE